VPCKFSGGVVVGVDSYRAAGGGWVRMAFRNVNGPALAKAELVAGDTVQPMTNNFGGPGRRTSCRRRPGASG
jgi:hypothetical protein